MGQELLLASLFHLEALLFWQWLNIGSKWWSQNLGFLLQRMMSIENGVDLLDSSNELKK